MREKQKLVFRLFSGTFEDIFWRLSQLRVTAVTYISATGSQEPVTGDSGGVYLPYPLNFDTLSI